MQVRRETFDWLPPEALRLDDFDEQTRGELLLVAEDEPGHLVGFVSVWEEDNFIHHLYVSRAYHRRGIGSALLKALPGWPSLRYRLKCQSANVAALAFYKASLFAEINSGESEDGHYLLLESRASHDF